MDKVDPAAVVQKWMMKMADAIARQAEAAAAGYKDVPGDIALRAFADTIRQTNAKSGYMPDEIVH